MAFVGFGLYENITFWQVALSSFYEGDNDPAEGGAPIPLDDDEEDDSDDDNVPMDTVQFSRSDAKAKAKKAPKSSK